MQAVDHAVPAVADLIAPFRFVPNWRIDDVMVSYAADGGGVGPHFDQYDVFLIQGLGTRRWQVGGHCDAATPLQPNADLRLIAGFVSTDEWLLGPGDILYVPPGFAHHGVAEGSDCMTYSIGFRAPSAADLVAGWSDAVLDVLADDDRYADPGLLAQANPGEIAAPALATLHDMVMARLGDPTAFAAWFGEYATTRKYPDLDWTPEIPVDAASLRLRLAANPRMTRNPASRFAFIRRDGGVDLFVDGDRFDCDTALAETLCASDRLVVGAVADPALALLVDLVNRGSLILD